MIQIPNYLQIYIILCIPRKVRNVPPLMHGIACMYKDLVNEMFLVPWISPGSNVNKVCEGVALHLSIIENKNCFLCVDFCT